MPLLVRNVSLAWEEPEENLPARVARALRIPPAQISACRILRRALDARRHGDIRRIYSVEVQVQGQEQQVLRRARAGQAALYVEPPPPTIEPGNQALPSRPVIIGSGPAGLFAALLLADHGYRPLLLERGQDAPLRHRARHHFYTTGQFDPENNLLFGIGGAGTYSDGKLYSRTRDPRNTTVLNQLVRFGADPDIIVNTKPHIGSDRLPGIVRKIVKHIVAQGGEVRFGARVVDFELADVEPTLAPASSPADARASTSSPSPTRRIVAIRLESGQRIDADLCILAIGYSARDTYRILSERGVELQAKPFQMGVRIEHPQDMISRSQYGPAADRLPPADYQLVAKISRITKGQSQSQSQAHSQAQTQGDLWSFCMCPGGIIVPSNESHHEICTNGASNAKHNSPYANSGLVITIDPAEFDHDPLRGLEYQRHWERLAFQLSGSYAVPAQRAHDFLAQRRSDGQLDVSYPLGASPVMLQDMLPAAVTAALHRGLPMLNNMIRGYASDQGIITGPETRASSPVRIPRDDLTRQSSRVAGLYPVGEGAGYSGGIMSSATDGLKSAEKLIAQFAPAT